MTISSLAAITGTYGRVSVGGGSPLTVDKYSVKFHGVDLPTTNFESQQSGQFGTVTYEEGLIGIQGCDISWEGCYDANNTPFGGIGVYPGLQTTVNIYVSKSSNKFFAFPSVRILDCTVSNDVNGLVRYVVSAKSNGSFTVPV